MFLSFASKHGQVPGIPKKTKPGNAESVAESNNPRNSPNRFACRDSGAKVAQIVGISSVLAEDFKFQGLQTLGLLINANILSRKLVHVSKTPGGTLKSVALLLCQNLKPSRPKS